MTAQRNAQLARSLYSAFNARKFDDAVKVVSDKAQWRNMATGEVFHGPSGAMQFMQGWVSAFDDMKVDVRRVIATDTELAVEIMCRGTHTGPLELPGGTLPATNKQVEVPICEICTIESGKLGSGASYFDSATLLHQLGVSEMAAAHR